MRARIARRPLVGFVVILLLLEAGVPAVVWPQEVDPRVREQLQGLSAEERARLLEELAGAPTEGAELAPPIDDRFAPRPLGSVAPPDSLLTELEPLPPPRSGLQRFGRQLFAQAPGVFAPPTYGPVPADYRLGPGDAVVVQVWGEVHQRRESRVGRDGTLVLRDAGQIAVGGLTLAAAEREITRRLARVMSGIDQGSTHVSVTLGPLRSIQVFVVGEAMRPSGYQLSAVATVFHALYAAGGPSDIGSMRAVQLIRDNRVQASLDLYSILLHGTREGDVALRDGDTVFVPVAARSVTVDGEVRRPGIFELREAEGLVQAIRFAGGLTPSARADVAHIRRILPPARRGADGRDRVDLDAPLDRLFDPTASEFELVDGDVVTVLAVSPREEHFVLAGGSVVHPGRYGFVDGMRLSDLLRRARGLWRDALEERALLIRHRNDTSKESYSVDLRNLTPGGPGDLALAPMDSLHVFSLQVRPEHREVTIHGEVASPGRYEFLEYMTVRDLVLAAGGLLQTADDKQAEVSRVDPTSRERASLATVARLPLDDSGAAERFVLQNHDQVFVRTIPGYELQRNVELKGEVEYPGTYTLLHREERLSEVIARAGGLRETAYPAGFRLYRTADDVGNLGLDLRKALENPGSRHDVILQTGDRIEIPPQPMSVKVVGAVGFPTSVIWQGGRSIGDYIDSAGGYGREADQKRTKVIYPNGLSAKVRRWWRDPSVPPGSTIFVPTRDREEGIDWGSVIVGTTQVLSSLATIYLVIDRAGN